MILGILLIPSIVYGIVVLFSAYTLATKNLSYENLAGSAQMGASIIVAARNEEEAIGELVDALEKQDLEGIQIVIANDLSEDTTEEVVQRRIAQKEAHENTESDKLLLVNRDESDIPSGKAGALHKGIEASSGSIILTTDADCRPPSSWASNMAELASMDSVGVVAGITCILGNRHIDDVQKYDWMFLQSASASLALLGSPVTAMGNNMAFSKANYRATGGYPSLPESVTEDFILFKSIPEYTAKEALLIPDEGFKNYTQAAESTTQMFRQRKRWALGGLGGGPQVWSLYAMTSIAHWATIATCLLFPVWGALLLILKLLCDKLLVRAGFRRLNEPEPKIMSYLSFQLWLFYYMMIMPFSLAFKPKVTWKGRSFK